jgi:DNA topoisomerase-1
MNVVVVESPAKAKTINKYLGKDFKVLASYGHVRDLPAKDGSVRPDEGFAMTWVVDARANKRINDIADALKGANRLYLATDPDREGEAISWHITEELNRRRALEGIEVHRVVFNEITESAVKQAFAQPRTLNQELIDAYLARRALDYLVGFTLSPILWRKLPGSRSAGRVQSVALRLVCDREAEIEAFRPREYWSVEAVLAKASGESFKARLIELDGRKLERYDLADGGSAEAACRRLREARNFQAERVEPKKTRRNPQPPFTTSTLQQEASRKLGFGASRTMRLAQQLYEGVNLGGETVGLITYMRTDGVQIAEEAIAGTRRLIQAKFGDPYLPDKPRRYSAKAKNAQEAHEAVRPTDVSRGPDQLARRLEPDQLKLYELIWKRTLASQMESARIDQVVVDIAVDGKAAKLRANGSVIAFPGFLALYQEGRDENRGINGGANGAAGAAGGGEDERRLPPIGQGGLRGAALHPAAAALHRGQPGQESRGVGDRPPLDLRVDPAGPAGPRLRAPRKTPLRRRGPGPRGHRLPGRILRALRPIQLHRRHGDPARRHLRRTRGMDGGPVAILERFHPSCGGNQGPARR